MKTQILALSLTLLLSACASGPKLLPAPQPAPAETAKPSPLAGEERWLNEWFSGTPVEIGAQDNGTLRVAVPLQNSFDNGQVKVKAPLAAVLDKVATSMRRQAGTKVEITAPAHPSAGVRERSQSLQNYLVSKGVRADRIVRTGAPAHMVELRLVPAPQAIERLNDTPVTGSGTSASQAASKPVKSGSRTPRGR